jgi:hypothetical protein
MQGAACLCKVRRGYEGCGVAISRVRRGYVGCAVAMWGAAWL